MSNSESQSIGRLLRGRRHIKSALVRAISKRFDRLLDSVQQGQLTLTWPDGQTTVHGERSLNPKDNANVTLHSLAPLRRIFTAGQLGFAESYLQGEWSTDSLNNLFTLVMNNESGILQQSAGSWHERLLNSVRHGRNHNSLRGSQRNIEFHYDLGNEFYKLWLDRSMSYSSALFRDGNESLEQAQMAKLDQVSEFLSPKNGANVLEIGCGWGGLASHLATGKDCKVDGISLSTEQLDYAREHNSVDRASVAGGRTRYRYKDYREVTGRFDHIVSIEMFEAVGERYWATYFQKLADLLEQGGTALLQVITIAEDRFEAYRSQPDFIQRYIFPGGMLPSKTHLSSLVHQAGFEIVESDWFGLSYARTLDLWRERFDRVAREVQTLGFDDRFQRMWRYYLSYCETGFLFERTDVGQLLLARR